MFLRVTSVVTVLLTGLVIGLMTDLGFPGGQALAQYYPPPPVQPYPAQSYPGQYRPQPPAQIDSDDDLDALGPPGDLRGLGRPASAGAAIWWPRRLPPGSRSLCAASAGLRLPQR